MICWFAGLSATGAMTHEVGIINLTVFCFCELVGEEFISFIVD